MLLKNLKLKRKTLHLEKMILAMLIMWMKWNLCLFQMQQEVLNLTLNQMGLQRRKRKLQIMKNFQMHLLNQLLFSQSVPDDENDEWARLLIDGFL
uniref:Uncharacterized protein n=1 Tax=Cannabis sativa TaxID=3483 RepID=A0A803R4P3_CANSA